MAIVTILGGCGFLGTNLVDYYTKENHEVRVFGRGELLAHSGANVILYPGDFCNSNLLRKVVDGSDIVYHLIGATNPITAEGDRLVDLHQNIVPTLGLLDLGASGAYQKIIFISSGGTVYGKQESCPIEEDSPQWPISAYGVTKVAIEKYLYLYNHLYGLDYRIARVSNPFGEHQHLRRGQGVMRALIDCALQSKTFEMVGNGSVVRDYIYVRDLVSALHAMVCYKGDQRVFNVGSGVGASLLYILKLVESVTNRQINIKRLPSRAIDVPVNVLDISRITRELGWVPTTPMKEAIQRTVDWASGLSPNSKAYE